MKIASVNINNINRRMDNLLAWLKVAKPDVVCLQELKCTDRQFPATTLAEAGYGAVWVGQSAWNGRLIEHAQELFDSKLPVVLAGDYNIVPEVRDIYVTTSYRDNALVQAEPREQFERLIAQGWTDALRKAFPDEPALYTFWDYMRNRWPRTAGLRLDHMLLSKKLGKALTAAGIDRDARGREGASDHAPVWIELKV